MREFIILVIFASFLVDFTIEQVQIKCYSCIAPVGVTDITTVCNSSLFCKGQYCTKGPDALSNGIKHGCTDTPPLDSGGTKCKWVTTKTGKHANCYCKNIDYCNSSRQNPPPIPIFIITITISIIFRQMFR
ncbi:unnamed protein product [Caenorhabditis angaria]|uniref:UPAR/Ly6 domain-containing protein n=1 Tax=Caenorhabditis angaria TaxID=860376 RepID=A0A9P1J2U9_9PELO|nr:unnamed protein product [Caenorhabditis angaria]